MKILCVISHKKVPYKMLRNETSAQNILRRIPHLVDNQCLPNNLFLMNMVGIFNSLEILRLLGVGTV